MSKNLPAKAMVVCDENGYVNNFVLCIFGLQDVIFSKVFELHSGAAEDSGSKYVLFLL